MDLLQLLLDCQKVEMDIADCESGLRNSPVRKKLLHARSYIVNAQENYQQMEADVVKISAALEELTSRYEENAARAEAESVHYAAADEESDLADVLDMERESKEIANALSRNEQDLTALVKRLATIDQEMKKMAANLPRARQDYAKLKEVYDKDLAVVQAQTAPLKEKLAELEKQVPEAMLRKYKNVRQHVPNAVVPMENGRCSGCHMELASAALMRLKNQGMAECENCGRLLYTKE